MKNVNNNIFSILLILSFISCTGLVLFSFTQVDLSLTLSQQTIFQTIQKSFQYIGFYQRPLATAVYIFLLVLMTSIYVMSLYCAKKNCLNEKKLWMVIAIHVTMLFFSYPAAFSYDIFNYIFTAKTVLLYGKNPYIVKPLDFEGIDPMLSFMRWTHLPSAYTPLWIALSLIPYVMSFGSLLLTIWMMKIIPILCYVITIFFIGKILQKNNPSHKMFGMIAFALNPLVIIEVLVSAHNDIVMMACALVAFSLYLRKKHVLSFFSFAFSVALKFVTISLFPLFFTGWSAKKALLLLTGMLAVVLLRREFLPWYMLWIIPVAVLLSDSRLLIIISGVSLGLLLKYAPLFYYGIDPKVTNIQNALLMLSIAVSGFFALMRKNMK
jgi:hypothetical protein